MAEIELRAARVDTRTYQVTFVGVSAQSEKWVYLDGVLWSRVFEPFVLVTAPDGLSVSVQAFDSAGDTPGAVYPQQAVLRWFGVTGAVEYVVEELVASVWTERKRIVADVERPYVWVSGGLADDTVHMFRVLGVAASGRTSVVREQAFRMVRPPDAPSVVHSWDDVTGLNVVAA